MPRICPINKISYQKIKSRSHSMRATIKHRNPNFVVKKVGNKKVKISARAWKTIRTKKQDLAIVLSNVSN